MKHPERQIFINYNNFSKTEKKIADYVIDNYNNIPFISTAQLATNIGVAESSIIRFTRSLGYSGLKDFKYAIISTSSRQAEEMTLYEDSKNTFEQLMKQYIKINIDNFQNHLDVLDYQLLEKVAYLILESENVYLAGAGQTGKVVEDFHLKLRGIFSHVHLSTTVFEVNQESNHLTLNDLIFAVSNTGISDTPVTLAEFGQKSGAKVVVLTGAKNSPLYELGDYRILVTSTVKNPGTRYFANLLMFRIITDSLFFYLKTIKD